MTQKAFIDTLLFVVESGLVLGGILALLIWIKDKTKRISYLRLFVQLVSFLAIYATIAILGQWSWLVLGSILLMTVFFGRFFCGWICPLGFYLDLTTLAQKSLGVKHLKMSDNVNLHLHHLRYLFATMVLVYPFAFGVSASVLQKFVLFEAPFKPLITYFLGPMDTLLIPYPNSGLMTVFTHYSVTFPYVWGISNYLGRSQDVQIASWALVLTIIVSGFLYRRFWCRFCPTGVSIAVVNRFRGLRWMPLFHLNKVEEKCTKCGICERVCPVQVTEVYEKKGGVITTSMCTACLRCLEMCPYEGCMTFDVGGKTIIKSRNWLEPFTEE